MKVSNSGPYEITNKDQLNNELVRNILSVNGVEGIFLGQDFISVNKNEEEKNNNLSEIEEKIVKILDQKIRPAVARDGGDIKFKEFKDGIVKVQLQGSLSLIHI